jgi:hypothetical protein
MNHNTERRRARPNADDARARAEFAIEKILLNLESDTGKRLASVEVDTRNFANCNVEIFFDDEHS